MQARYKTEARESLLCDSRKNVEYAEKKEAITYRHIFRCKPKGRIRVEYSQTDWCHQYVMPGLLHWTLDRHKSEVVAKIDPGRVTSDDRYYRERERKDPH